MTRRIALAMTALPAILMIAVLCGCATTPSPGAQVTPTATATPEVTPEVTAGDFAEIRQEISVALSQIQNTLTTVTNNFALDAERAKLERAKQRDAVKREAGQTSMWVGLCLLFFTMPAPPLGYWRGVIITVAVSMVAGGNLLPSIWPF